VKATSGAKSATAAITYAGQAEWVSSTAAAWTASGAWKDAVSGNTIAAPGVRGITGDTVSLGSGALGTIDLNGSSPSLASIAFSGATSATIAQGSGGSLLMNNGVGTATMTVSAGSHAISAPVVLDGSLALLPAGGSQLTISGGISGPGQSLTVGDPGSVILNGANSYTGGTTITSGTLVLANSSAIAAGTSMTVGANGAGLFQPSAASIAVAAAITAPVVESSDKNVSAASWPRFEVRVGPDSGKKTDTQLQAVDAVFANFG
jgi:autotransporter-associated beta strand protein